MVIQDKKYGNFILTPEGSETLEDIAIAIIMASYESAGVFGYGTLRAFETILTKEMAKKMLLGEDISRDYDMNHNYKKNEVYMDYVFGRCCKTGVKIKDDYVDVRISERDRQPLKIIKKAKELIGK